MSSVLKNVVENVRISFIKYREHGSSGRANAYKMGRS
jgi:hypothetical protein